MIEAGRALRRRLEQLNLLALQMNEQRGEGALAEGFTRPFERGFRIVNRLLG